ncbi:MAG: formate--tetrahydrofolate ligase, partial [Gelidibacter sp.]
MKKICQTIYGGENIVLSDLAKSQLRKYEEMGYGNLPVCMAKTEKSFSDDQKRLGRPEQFDIHIREFELAAGAGFIIPIAGNMLRMPGLPATPAAEKITIDKEGVIEGLF